jgi:hypothetical protein
MPRENFTVYSNNLETGDIIINNKTIIDDKDSRIRFLTTIYDMYDKAYEDENRVLIGQFIWNKESIKKFIISYRVSTSQSTCYFENGSISIEWNTFNWKLGDLIVATIIYGTGEYLGVTGYVEIDVTENEKDVCKDTRRLTSICRFLFTN